MALRILIFALVILSMFFLPAIPAVVSWDHAALDALVAMRGPLLTRLSWTVTKIGSSWGLIPAALAAVFCHLRRRRPATAACYAAGVLLLKASEALLKAWIGRPRPAGGLQHLVTASMPSGHGINAVVIFGVLGVFLLRRLRPGWARSLAFAACMAAILAVDLSRVCLAMHYPSDVLMGSLYGAAGLWLFQGLRADLLDF